MKRTELMCKDVVERIFVSIRESGKMLKISLNCEDVKKTRQFEQEKGKIEVFSVNIFVEENFFLLMRLAFRHLRANFTVDLFY